MKTAWINTLKDRISIVEMPKTTSATGAPVETESLVKSCRANHMQNTVDEEEDGKIRALFTDKFIIRYDNQFTKGKANAMYVIDSEGFKYNIVSVVEIKRKKYLQINTVRRE